MNTELLAKYANRVMYGSVGFALYTFARTGAWYIFAAMLVALTASLVIDYRVVKRRQLARAVAERLTSSTGRDTQKEEVLHLWKLPNLTQQRHMQYVLQQLAANEYERAYEKHCEQFAASLAVAQRQRELLRNASPPPATTHGATDAAYANSIAPSGPAPTAHTAPTTTTSPTHRCTSPNTDDVL